MVRGLVLGVALVYGAYLARNAVMVARVLAPAIAQWRRDARVLDAFLREPWVVALRREQDAIRLAAYRPPPHARA